MNGPDGGRSFSVRDVDFVKSMLAASDSTPPDNRVIVLCLDNGSDLDRLPHQVTHRLTVSSIKISPISYKYIVFLQVFI